VQAFHGDDQGDSLAARTADAAEELSNTRTLDVLARFGFAVLGLVHILIGAIAVRIAFGSYGEADPAGAVDVLAASAPFGPIVMWSCFLGCGALSIWQFSEATLRARHLPRKRERLSKAISSGSLSITYGLFSLTFARYALGGRSDSGESTKDLTAALLATDLGVPLLVAAGGTVFGIGVYFVVKALRQKFKEELNLGMSKRGQTVNSLGVFGHIAKGVALMLMGLLIVIATLKHNPAESTGLDGGLKALPEHPFGVPALLAIALGLICYGIFAVIRARYGRM
jgi:hypothetical protein